jgi:hypothetical protein
MFNKLTIAATFAAAVAVTSSASFGAPPSRPFASTRQAATYVDISGAQWWQDKANAEDMGIVYHR